MKLPARALVVAGGAGIVALLTFLYVQSRSADLVERERFERELRHLRQSDTALNQEVLKLRFGYLRDYDFVTAELGQLERTLGALERAPAFATPAHRATLAARHADYAALVRRKAALLERFKSKNAVLGNSLEYFPELFREVVEEVRLAPEAVQLEPAVNGLALAVLAFGLAPTAERELDPEIGAAFAQLEDWRKRHPQHGVAEEIDGLVAHARSILRRKPRVDDLVRELVSVPTTAGWDAYFRAFEASYAEAVARANAHRGVLFVACVGLVAGIGYVMVALRRALRRLRERTVELQQEVAERKQAAAELRWKSALLEAQADASPDGILVVDTEGRRLFQNRVLAGVWKISAEDAAAACPLPGLRSRVADAAAFDALVAPAVANREATTRGELALEGGATLDCYSAPVRGPDGTLYGRIWTARDITERKEAEARLEETHRQLVQSSRQAGMAEVATGVLHNVGNVLNSVNVSTTVLSDSVRRSKVPNLARLADLLAQQADLPAFFSTDPRGPKVPVFLRSLAEHLAGEQAGVLQELGQLRKNIEHIKDIVAMQQGYAKVSGAAEAVAIGELIDDALRMNGGSFALHGIEVVRDVRVNPVVTVEKHKVLQILVNLLRNAKHACDGAERSDKRITIAVAVEDGRAKVSVSDNGVGIPAENLTRIFSHGFTTRKNGHGFGLHSGALAAKELRGALRASSDGAGCGATFVLELPYEPEERSAEAAQAA